MERCFFKEANHPLPHATPVGCIWRNEFPFLKTLKFLDFVGFCKIGPVVAPNFLNSWPSGGESDNCVDCCTCIHRGHALGMYCPQWKASKNQHPTLVKGLRSFMPAIPRAHHINPSDLERFCSSHSFFWQRGHLLQQRFLPSHLASWTSMDESLYLCQTSKNPVLLPYLTHDMNWSSMLFHNVMVSHQLPDILVIFRQDGRNLCFFVQGCMYQPAPYSDQPLCVNEGIMTKCHNSRNLHIAAKIGHYPFFFLWLLFMKVAHYPRDVKPLLHGQLRGGLPPFLSNLPHSSGKSRGKID